MSKLRNNFDRQVCRALGHNRKSNKLCVAFESGKAKQDAQNIAQTLKRAGV